MKPRMTIGKLAEAAGVGVETIRFYQRSGLLQEPERPILGFREYTKEDVRRVRFIKRAQMLGFSLNDIAGLLKLDGPQTCRVAHDLALAKLHLVEEKIAALDSIQNALRQMVRRCERKHKRGSCPIIETLVEDER
ncbi:MULTISPECIES: MerR family transcriptional regulator [Acidobacterium]|uniref:MerR family transcriptional regulator n=1 Tax=Acidobacterium TaxID=33973 RepID=UPI0005A1A366|nr:MULTISPECIES: MerR family transcriptional regulator [Acidobacterium]HCT59522.1 MerR family DNA-binding transcriptional regulator [Acidobacterium sp.]